MDLSVKISVEILSTTVVIPVSSFMEVTNLALKEKTCKVNSYKLVKLRLCVVLRSFRSSMVHSIAVLLQWQLAGHFEACEE